MSRRLRLPRALACLVLIGSLTACSSGGVSTTTTLLPDDALPTSTFAGGELDDLRIEPADVAAQVEDREGLLTATGMWRVLADGEVVATVQLGELVDGVDDLESRLLGQFGAVRPQPLRVGQHVVHVASGNGRTDTLALLERRLLVVSVDDAFTRRRALVRHLLAVVEAGAP